MSEEEAFIRAILADPSDTDLRLVYADWLEERGDGNSIQRAEYLRIECELDKLTSKDRKRARLRDRLAALRRTVGDDWWRQLDWANVESCVKFRYRCPQRWDTLQPTEDPAVRHCTECDRNVYYCRNTEEAYRLADAGECVAIDSRRVRLPLALLRRAEGTGRTLGRVAPRVPRRLPLSERGSRKRTE